MGRQIDAIYCKSASSLPQCSTELTQLQGPGVRSLEAEFAAFEDVALHPNIVRVPGYTLRNGVAALVMEAGESVSDRSCFLLRKANLHLSAVDGDLLQETWL